MCKSVLHGQQNHASAKISFITNLLSPMLNYTLNYDLLQFQYDRWLFKTITGTINSAKTSGCSPNTRLQDKSFSAMYWKWQHQYLIDAVHHFGFPSFFFTISPYEWSFPCPPFIQHIGEQCGREPTDLASLETLNVPKSWSR